METEISNLSISQMDNSTLSDSDECEFYGINSFSDLTNLLRNTNCHKHGFGMSLFLFIANLGIFLFGLIGNSLVIYVVIWRMKTRNASSIFILNMAVADLLVIIGCIPATLLANLIIPWFMGEPMCKIVAYGQGVSVSCAVLSLVAITFDRFRAIHKTTGGFKSISISCAYKIVGCIWVVGLAVTIPWAIVFKVVEQNSMHDKFGNIWSLPYCQEVWSTKTQEITYFIVIHVFACYILPLILIIICDVIIWKNVHADNFASTPSQLHVSNSIQEIQRKRKIRMLKMFTGLTLAFFLFWLPLYVITFRVKFFYTNGFNGTPLEQQILSILIPVSQLLGSCNSCVNPVLYALLNQTFRESFKQLFSCVSCVKPPSRLTSAVELQEHNDVPFSQSRKTVTENSKV